MPSDPEFIKATAGLRTLGGQRVWSLMISLFGDLALDADQAIDGPVLSAMMALLQVKPEAARVALHRLRNDGWIASQKSGRISRHRLTAQGLTESATASPLIYADPDGGPTDWHMVLLATPDPNMAYTGYTQVHPGLYIGATALPLPQNALRLSAETTPDWLISQVAPEALRLNYQALLAVLETLQTDFPTDSSLSPLQVAVLRGLIVHNWRRLVLKHPVLPQPLIADDWPGQRCHHHIADLLARFPRPALSEIEPPRNTA